MKTKIIITGGKVHEVGYRPFLLGIAESLELERFFADNTFEDGKEAVYVLLDCSEEKIKTFKEIVRSKLPENAAVNQILEEEYTGTVTKTENYYRYLSAMQLSKIVTYGGKMLQKQDETIVVIKEESHKTRKTVREKSHKTQDELKAVIQEESQKTRETIGGESRMTRDTLVEHLKNDIAEIKEKIAG
ncbi:MAG TPA: acylphosphatase [Euryarchaeota archaeon]|nr:acylphosphatase [Euryarchaeota archaeon]